MSSPASSWSYQAVMAGNLEELADDLEERHRVLADNPGDVGGGVPARAQGYLHFQVGEVDTA